LQNLNMDHALANSPQISIKGFWSTVPGQQIGPPFKLCGGEPERESFRIYESDQNAGVGHGKLWLRGYTYS